MPLPNNNMTDNASPARLAVFRKKFSNRSPAGNQFRRGLLISRGHKGLVEELQDRLVLEA